MRRMIYFPNDNFFSASLDNGIILGEEKDVHCILKIFNAAFLLVDNYDNRKNYFAEKFSI